jgi:hypothetical protein
LAGAKARRCFVAFAARLHKLRKNSVDLKGHGFSRATKSPKRGLALAAEGMQAIDNAIPEGLKPNISCLLSYGTAEAVPFQNRVISRSRRVFPLPVNSCPDTSCLAESVFPQFV